MRVLALGAKLVESTSNSLCQTERVPERPVLLASFDGVSVEGGYDVEWGPPTCFMAASHLGQCAPFGDADLLWDRYELAIDALVASGVGGIQLVAEWARLEPRRGDYDSRAVMRYRRALTHARARGLVVHLAMIDRAWPAWLGSDAWIMPWVVPAAVAHAQYFVNALGDLADDLIVFTDADRVIADGYLSGTAPPWREGEGNDAASARRQIERIESAISTLDGWKISTRRSAALPVVDSLTAMRSMLEQHSDADTVVLRSALRGHGPVAVAAGLLEWHGDRFALRVPWTIEEFRA